MNSCRYLLALFPLHELLMYHTWLIQTISPSDHYHAPVYTESPNPLCCTTSLWLRQKKASHFFKKRTERLLHCSKHAQLLKPQHLGKHWQFLFRTLQFLLMLPGVGGNLLASSTEWSQVPVVHMSQYHTWKQSHLVLLLGCSCKDQFAPTPPGTWDRNMFVTAKGEHNTGKAVALWSSVGEASHAAPVNVPLSSITPWPAH